MRTLFPYTTLFRSTAASPELAAALRSAAPDLSSVSRAQAVEIVEASAGNGSENIKIEIII
jgi:hypothetical protein